MAYRMVQAKPDFVMITGDIVYGRGRVSEYREKLLAGLQRRRALPLGRAARCSGRP